MKTTPYSFLIAVIILFWSTMLSGQGFRLTINVPDLPDKDLILSHRLGLKFYTDDTVRTDLNGQAIFKNDHPMPEGMYQVVFADKKYAEFFLDKNQNFSLSTRASAPMDSLSFSGSPENNKFLDWQRKNALNRSRASLIQNRLKRGTLTTDSTRLLNSELQEIQKSNTRLWDSAIQDLEGTLPGTFIHGLKPVKVPESLVKPDSPDSQIKQYQYVRVHFFDRVDLTDERLLRTPLIETKLDQYFKQIVPQIPDTLIQDSKKIIEKSRPAKSVFQYVVQYLFNLYTEPQIMGTDAVYVYIADNYYLAGETPWIDSANLRGIRTRVNELKPLLLGKVTPVLEGLVDINEHPFEIRTIKSKFLVLFFWSPDCGFCKEATPRLYAQYAELKQMGVEVAAINTRLEKDLWTKFITDNRLSWINLYSPQKAREMVEKYQAFTTPQVYILDSELRIIAKSISVDQIKPFFIQYLAGR